MPKRTSLQGRPSKKVAKLKKSLLWDFDLKAMDSIFWFPEIWVKAFEHPLVDQMLIKLSIVTKKVTSLSKDWHLVGFSDLKIFLWKPKVVDEKLSTRKKTKKKLFWLFQKGVRKKTSLSVKRRKLFEKFFAKMFTARFASRAIFSSSIFLTVDSFSSGDDWETMAVTWSAMVARKYILCCRRSWLEFRINLPQMLLRQ